eukprot:gene5216-5496_t
MTAERCGVHREVTLQLSGRMSGGTSRAHDATLPAAPGAPPPVTGSPAPGIPRRRDEVDRAGGPPGSASAPLDRRGTAAGEPAAARRRTEGSAPAQWEGLAKALLPPTRRPDAGGPPTVARPTMPTVDTEGDHIIRNGNPASAGAEAGAANRPRTVRGGDGGAAAETVQPLQLDLEPTVVPGPLDSIPVSPVEELLELAVSEHMECDVCPRLCPQRPSWQLPPGDRHRPRIHTYLQLDVRGDCPHGGNLPPDLERGDGSCQAATHRAVETFYAASGLELAAEQPCTRAVRKRTAWRHESGKAPAFVLCVLGRFAGCARGDLSTALKDLRRVRLAADEAPDRQQLIAGEPPYV